MSKLADYSVHEVCDLISSLQLNPAPFKENAVEGSDLIELSDKELEDYLGLKPLQIKKIRKAISDLLEEESGAGESHGSIMDKYKHAISQPAAAAAPAAFGGSSFGGGASSSRDDNPFKPSTDARFNGAPDSSAGADGRPPPPLKPAERGFAKTVSAASGEELADADNEVETELFGQGNTGINFELYETIHAEATGNNVPPPITSFEQAKFHPNLMSNIALAGYKSPTPVQKHGFAIAMGDRDLMACAQTGSGKTAAFLFPMISHLLQRGRSVSDELRESGSRFPVVTPEALILAPTRELACQIFDEARKFCYRTWVRPAVAYGGTQSIRNIDDMQRNGCHLLVATPGRLNDFIERRKISLRKVKYVVLDEADRMLDMGFEPQIRKIVEQADLPKEGRQTLLFSATFPNEIQKLAGDFLNDYIFLSIGRVGSTSTNIKQNIEYVEEDDKHQKLLELCTLNKGLTLIFVQTKVEANSLEVYLTQQGFQAVAIHGDREQWQREESLELFRKGIKPFLVATDVASRGLDIPNVTHVINFDMPATIDDYVHRIGRTGRVGKTGVATSFFNNQDTSLAADLVQVLKEVDQQVAPWLAACAQEQVGGRSRYKFTDARRGGGGGGGGHSGRGDGGYGGSSGGADFGSSSGGGDW